MLLPSKRDHDEAVLRADQALRAKVNELQLTDPRRYARPCPSTDSLDAAKTAIQVSSRWRNG